MARHKATLAVCHLPAVSGPETKGRQARCHGYQERCPIRAESCCRQYALQNDLHGTRQALTAFAAIQAKKPKAAKPAAAVTEGAAPTAEKPKVGPAIKPYKNVGTS